MPRSMQFTERRREIYNHAYGKGADLRYRARENVRRHANDAAPAQKRPKWSFRPPAPGSQRQSVTGAASGLLTVMGGMAEFERKLVRARCEEGIRRALARGTVFGRKSVLDAGERRRIAERYAAGETMAVAREYKVGEATVWRALRAG